MGEAGALAVESTGEYSQDGREMFAYTIRNGEGEVLQEGQDLRSGVGGEADAEKMMASLLGFLGASAEAVDEQSDNWDLFNAGVREWAKANADEIAVLEVETEKRIETSAIIK